MNRWNILLSSCFALMASVGTVSAIQDKPKSESSAAAQEVDAKNDDTKPAEKVNPPEPTTFAVADGQLKLSAPGDWKKIEPASTMIDAEFSIDPVEGDAKACRLTVMGAGGTIDANIERWLGQVQQPDGSSTKDKATITKKEIDGVTVHVVDVAGTIIDQRGGPQAPKVELKNYRLLAAILETDTFGNYFVKLYGPEKTIAKHKDAFVKMVEEAKLTEK